MEKSRWFPLSVGLDTQSNDRDSYWPDWPVIAKGQRRDGLDVTITMYFEAFKGDLGALHIDAPRRQSCANKE